MSRLLRWVRTESDRAVGAALVVLGGVLLVVTYLLVDDHAVIVDQLSRLILGGIGGLLLVGLGSMVLVLSDLTDEWHKLDRIDALLDGQDPPSRRPGLLGLSAPLRAPVVFGALGTVVGVVVVLVAWHRATGQSDPNEAFGSVALAVGGLVVAAGAALSSTFWFVRVVRLRASRLFAPWLVEDLLRARVRADGAQRPRSAGRALPSTPTTVVVGGGLRRFHVPACAVLATGGPYDEVELARVPRGLAPCGLCLPELADRAVPEGAVTR